MNTSEGNKFREMLLFFRRIRTRLHIVDPATRFPVEEGWQSVKEHIGSQQEEEVYSDGAGVEGHLADISSRNGRIRSLRSYRYAAAAAVIFIMLSGGYWLIKGSGHDTTIGKSAFSKSKVAANLPPVRGVQLILAGGQRISVDKQQSLTEQNGTTIHMNNGVVEYLPAEATKDGNGNTGPKNAQEIFLNTLEVPRGNKSRLTLPDGTKVWINAASKLTYPTAFSGPDRELTLEGEAFFEVSKDMEHPFIVHTKGMDIKVLGTSFNVNNYDPVAVTTLVQGKVSVNGQSSTVTLEPGEQSRLDRTAGTLGKAKVNTKTFTAWKDGSIYMDDLSFGKIAEMLSRDYDYVLQFEDPSLQKLHFTIDMASTSDLQSVLDHISSTTEGIHFQTVGRTVTISR
jgi:transmembrane sensor